MITLSNGTLQTFPGSLKYYLKAKRTEGRQVGGESVFNSPCWSAQPELPNILFWQFAQRENSCHYKKFEALSLEAGFEDL